MKQTFIELFNDAVRRAKEANCLESLLPLLLWLNGKPYTLNNHEPFKPLFKIRVPPITIIKSGRQVGKSTSLAALSIIRCIAIPYHKIMFITPLQDQARNISDTYFKTFISDSPIGKYFIGHDCKKTTFYKEFSNRSRIAFRYANIDATRIRSYTNDVLIIDELQDFDESSLPVVSETLSASDWRIQFYAGTPLGYDNTLQKQWEESSKNEWLIKCQRCNYWNIPSIEYDLENMIGPFRDDIGPESPGTICAKCGKPISVRQGIWVPGNKELSGLRDGYHIPQIIIPMHSEDKTRWFELLEKRRLWPRQKFLQEVLGEASEEGQNILTESDLRAVTDLDSDIESIINRQLNWVSWVLGIDWGGGGTESESYTAICLAGLTQFGGIEIPWGLKMKLDQFEEADKILYYFDLFKPQYVVHDFTGGIGTLREAILVNRGMAIDKIIPVYIQGGSTNYVMTPVQMPGRTRTHYRIDRTKALQILAGAIKIKQVKFFNNEYDKTHGNLLHDFLSLIEDRRLSIGAREIYRITRRKNSSDDFAISCMLACSFLWTTFDAWPIF
jgi:hypothetical protein